MNRRAVISSIVGAVIIIGAYIGIAEFLSYKSVSLVFKQSDVTINLYTTANKKVTTISDDANIKLKTGQYYYVATNNKYDSGNIYFTITQDETVEINPIYSAEYLSSLLEQDKETIHTALTNAYPSITAGYIFSDEHVSQYGEWYSVKLIQRVSGGNQPDVYRSILKKENNTWTVVVSPRLIVSYDEFQSIPRDTIRQVNEPLSNEAYALLYPE